MWTESAGGRTRGRVYGTADLDVNLRHGSTSFIQQSQNSHGSKYVSLKAERAAREVREAKARADEAIA
ncbi:ARS-binding protein, partial [Trifolium medium]|nr:ARS-binding protein [Trifolium medium]